MDSRMGKQLGFYMTSIDETALLEQLHCSGDVLVQNYFTTSAPIAVTSFEIIRDIGDFDASLSVYCPEINPKILITELPGGKRSMDVTRSEVIEFNRCVLLNDGTLAPGRFWYDHQTMAGKPKRERFLKWADQFFRSIKATFNFAREQNGRYFAPDAWAKFNSNDLRLAPC